MHVTGRNDGLAQLIAKFNYSSVVVAKILFITGNSLTNEKRIVADGLYLKVIIERRYTLYPFFALLVYKRTEQFARFTC